MDSQHSDKLSRKDEVQELCEDGADVQTKEKDDALQQYDSKTEETEENTELLQEDIDLEVTSTSDLSGPDKYVPLPPDGGYGWVIVVASFLGNALVDGMCSTFGVFLPYFLVSFPTASVGKTALAGSLMPCLFLTTGPVTSALINCFGCRVVTMSGGLLTCVALILATYSPTVDVLIVTYGGLGGIGLALMYLPSMVMVGYYFEKRRAMAAGIASSGSGFGMLILAPLAAYLVSEYHWKGALVILSGVMLQGLVLGALMRPLESPSSKNSQSESELTEDDVLLDERAVQLKEVRCEQMDETKESLSNGITNNTKETFPLKTDESVQLYRKALQNALAQKHSLPLSKSTSSDFQNESQQHLSKHLDPGNYCFQNGVQLHNAKMSTTQSCHELPVSAPSIGRHRERANTESQHTLKSLHVPKTSGTVTAQSCHEIYAKSHSGVQNTPPVGANKAKLIQEVLKPLHRQDIFYGGSIASLPQYKSQPDLKSYIASVTVIPQLTEDDTATLCGCIPRSTLGGLKNLVDLTIISNPYFLAICLASVFIQIGYFIPIVYIVDYAVSLGSTTQEAAIIISVIGISNTMGRSVGGCLANLTWVNYLHLNNITLLLAGCATILVGHMCKSFAMLVIYAIVLGFCIGPFASLSTIFLVDYLGLKRLTNSFGLLSMVRGLSSIAGAPIAGVLLDATNSYTVTFYFGGSMFVCGSLAYYLLPCVKCCTKATSQVEKETNTA